MPDPRDHEPRPNVYPFGPARDGGGIATRAATAILAAVAAVFLLFLAVSLALTIIAFAKGSAGAGIALGSDVALGAVWGWRHG